MTEKPVSANRATRGPPPAPVPTTTKSTTSFSPNWCIGTQPPRLKTSGARPLAARGALNGSTDTIIPSLGPLDILSRLRLYSFPGIAAVQSHPNIAAWAGRSAESELIPGGGMRVIGVDDVRNDPVIEKQLAGHSAPRVADQLALLHPMQKRVLSFRR